MCILMAGLLEPSIKFSATDKFSPYFAIESMRMDMKRENTTTQPGLSPGSCKSQCFKVAQPLLNMEIGKSRENERHHQFVILFRPHSRAKEHKIMRVCDRPPFSINSNDKEHSRDTYCGHRKYLYYQVTQKRILSALWQRRQALVNTIKSAPLPNHLILQ